jgi:acyl carrier protein
MTNKITLEDVVAIIAETGVKADMENFDVDKTFEVNSIDSLDTYTILLALEEKTGVQLEEVELEKLNTAKLLQAYIQEKLA